MKFTVFTPTYNRAKLLSRVFESLLAQTYKDFEWLIIDDGSTDDTGKVVDNFSIIAPFPIRYFWRENKGKVASINEALDLAEGEFFLVFDSDDWCTADALEVFMATWNSLSEEERGEYSGVSCLKSFVNGKIVGEDYKRMEQFGETYVDRFNKRIKGDKWELIRTDVHRKYRYDLSSGERYLAPEYSWLLIGKEFKTVFINRSLSVVEYQTDGISKNNIKHRVGSSTNAMKFYCLANQCSTSIYNSTKSEINLKRFALHAGKYGLLSEGAVIASIMGFSLFFHDKLKITLRKKSRG